MILFVTCFSLIPFEDCMGQTAGGSIAGRVTSTSDGTGIGDVSIDIYDDNWDWVAYVMTDSSGNYTASGLGPGAYYLGTTNWKGYIDEWHANIAVIGSPWPPAGATAVPVTEGSLTVDINFILTLGGMISGQVTADPGGAAIHGAQVEVYDVSWNFVQGSYTDYDGNYTVDGLPTGNYYVATLNYQNYFDEWYDNVRYIENQSPPEGVTAVAVTESLNTPGINFGLTLGGSISGRVTSDQDGVGIQGVTIEVYDESWNFIESGWTDWEGYYSVGGLPTGNYYLGTLNFHDYFDEWYNNVRYIEGQWPPVGATVVAVAESSDTPGISFSLTLGGSISGRVTSDSDGAGIHGITVQVYDESGNYLQSGWTDWEGNYSVGGLLAGNYYVGTLNGQNYFDEWYNDIKYVEDQWPPVGAITVPVTESSDSPNINFSLILDATLSPSFSDVPIDHWAHNSIMAIFNAGITGGCEADNPQTPENEAKFCPDNSLTRGQMAVFIETSLGVALGSLPACSGQIFNDVNALTVGDTFCKFIEDFASRGITGGCGGGNYCPSDPVTRQQMAVFMEAALGRIPDQLPATCSESEFSDINTGAVGDLVCRIIEDFAVQGITGGCGNGAYCPEGLVTRAQMAVFLVTAPDPLTP
jgi:hypothetical protein